MCLRQLELFIGGGGSVHCGDFLDAHKSEPTERDEHFHVSLAATRPAAHGASATTCSSRSWRSTRVRLRRRRPRASRPEIGRSNVDQRDGCDTTTEDSSSLGLLNLDGLRFEDLQLPSPDAEELSRAAMGGGEERTRDQPQELTKSYLRAAHQRQTATRFPHGAGLPAYARLQRGSDARFELRAGRAAERVPREELGKVASRARAGAAPHAEDRAPARSTRARRTTARYQTCASRTRASTRRALSPPPPATHPRWTSSRPPLLTGHQMDRTHIVGATSTNAPSSHERPDAHVRAAADAAAAAQLQAAPRFADGCSHGDLHDDDNEPTESESAAVESEQPRHRRPRVCRGQRTPSPTTLDQ